METCQMFFFSDTMSVFSFARQCHEAPNIRNCLWPVKYQTKVDAMELDAMDIGETHILPDEINLVL